MSMYHPAHPGAILQELILEPLSLSIGQAAEHLQMNPDDLAKVVHEQAAITPELAACLARTFRKPSASHWLRLQQAYDAWSVRAVQQPATWPQAVRPQYA